MKYGSVAVVFTAIFIAIIILLNVLIGTLETRFGLYADLTTEKIYDISPASDTLLSSIDDRIEIIFCRDRDKLVSENKYMQMIVGLAEKYAAQYDNISVSFIDLGRRGKELNRFRATTSTTINTTDVIINAPDNGKYRHLRQASFFSATESGALFGFNGEMRITASILAVTKASGDKVVFTTGHDESFSSQITEIMINAGYDTSDSLMIVDLAKQDIPENTRLVIINNPRRDFSGYQAAKNGNVNEISKLDKYLSSHGNLFVLINNETPELPELAEFLEADWGISYHTGEIVEDVGNSLSADGHSIISLYNTDSEAHPYATEITRRITERSSSGRTIMSSTTPLYLATNAPSAVSPILQSSERARAMSGENVISTGKHTLMAISTKMEYVNNFEKFSHVIVSGSTDFFHSDIAYSSTANADLVYSILRLVGTEKVPIDIETKPFSDQSIASIGMATFKSTLVRLAVVLPLIVLAAGIYVYIRRRRL